MINEKKISSKGVAHPYLMGLLRVGFDSSINDNLGLVQLEVLYKLCVDLMTRKQIAESRKVKPQAIGNIINKLRAKGLIDKHNYPNVEIKLGGCSHQKNEGGSFSIHPKKTLGEYRLHGENMSVKILKTSLKYMKLLEEKSQLPKKNNTVMLYRGKLVIYSNTSFFSDEPDDCDIQSNHYWTQFYRILENELGITIINGSKTKIYQFRRHIGRTNDPLAQKVIKQKLHYQVIDDLGRERLIIDNSGKLFEHEATDKKLCIDDIKVIGDFDLNLIEGKFKPMEIKNQVNSLETIYTNTSHDIHSLMQSLPALNEYNKNLKLHIQVQQEQLKTQKDIQRLLKKLHQ